MVARSGRYRRPTTTSSTARCHDTGSTLVEIVISVVLMGTLIAAILAAVQTMVRTSSTVYEAAEVETVLLNASDQVERAPQLCDYEVYVDAAALAAEWSVDNISVVVEKLVANTGNEATDWAPQTCDPSESVVKPFDVQRLTIRATDPSGRITRTLTVVKSDAN